MRGYLFFVLLVLLASVPGRAQASFPFSTLSTDFSVTLNSPKVSGLSLPTTLVTGTYDVSRVPVSDRFICMIPYLDAASWNAGGASHLTANFGLDFTNQNFYFNPSYVCWPRPASNTGSFGYALSLPLGAHQVGILAMGLVQSPFFCGAGASGPCYSIPDGDGQNMAPIPFTVVATIPNNPPSVAISSPASNPYTSPFGDSIFFNGTASDPDTSDFISLYEWRDGSCTAGALLSSSTFATYAITSTLSAGSHIVYFRAKDSHDVWSPCASIAVNITPPPPPPPPTVFLSGNQTSLNVGGSETLSWSATNATSCTASGNWSGAKASSTGSETLPAYTATGTFTYTLSCTGAGGTVSAAPVTVTVTTAQLPFVGLFVSPTSVITFLTALVVPVGTPSAVLSWYSINATSCTASGAWSGAKGIGFTPSFQLWQQTVGPYATPGTYIYTLTCAGPGGASSASASVIVTGASCNLPWGGSIADGTSVTAYQLSSVIAPATCPFEVRTCSNGTLSGTLTNQSCIIITPMPNLTAGPTTASTFGTVGQSEPFSALVSNNGTGAASNFPNVFQIANANLTSTIARISTGTITSLGANSAAGISGSYAFASAGTYNVRACANMSTFGGTVIPESNLNDNCGAWSLISISDPACSNGASNYPLCNSCTLPLVWNGTSCAACNGGCGPGPVCSNGANNPPACSVFMPTAQLFANPSTIDSGQSTLLTWSSANATSCTAAGGFSTGGAASNSIGVSVRPSDISNPPFFDYQITCSGAGGTSLPSTARVTVRYPQASITANPLRVPAGSSSTITWSSVDAQSCLVSGPGLSQPTKAGSQLVTINNQSTYTITCQTNSAPISSSVTVNVIPTFQEF